MMEQNKSAKCLLDVETTSKPNRDKKRFIKKRDGRRVKFDKTKIQTAVEKAFESVDNELTEYSKEKALNIANFIETEVLSNNKEMISVEDIQDMVENGLMSTKRKDVAREYVKYRHDRDLMRSTTDHAILSMLNNQNKQIEEENSNKNPTLLNVQRDYMAGIINKDIAARYIIPEDLQKYHELGRLHIHDADFMAQPIHNCDLVNLEDMLQNGTVLNGIMIEKPHTLLTATTIVSQISLNVSAVQFGGQTMSLEHLAPFVDDSRKRYIAKYSKFNLDEETQQRLVEEDVKKEIRDSVQTFNYQVNSTISGQGQSPFISLWMYLGDAKTEQERDDLALLIEEVLRQRIQGMKNPDGVYITYAFPKLILCLDKYIMDENSKYHYLKRLAAECTSKRLVPDYISEKVMAENKVNQWGHGDVFPPMGCRSQLSPDFIKGNPANALNYKEGVGKYFGRFNHGVTTVNLLWCALEAKEEATNEEELLKLFYSKVENIMQEARRVQKLRAERLANTKAKVAPVLWQYGALARLQPEETLEKLVYGDYSTSSFGYNGLYETTKCLTGKDFWKDSSTYELAKDILKFLNSLCTKFKEEDNISYSLYGTPGESLNGKFGLCIKEHFGEDVFIKLDGHDREYLTNSCHIPVWEHIDAFSKLGCEADLQKLSLGGNIVYCESVDMSKNLDAVETVMDFIYDNNIYAELNCETSYCCECGSYNTIHLEGTMGNYVPTCSHCGNIDRTKMNYAVRVCGYISTNAFTQQRAGDINDRFKHLDNVVCD